MSSRPCVVCPIDFSDTSRAALSYAAAIADHFAGRLLAVAIEDPLLVAAAENAGLPDLRQHTEEELRRFVASAAPGAGDRAAKAEYAVAVGKPAAEILRLAQESGCELIVMSSQGRSGITKKFFGSTTERVLHATSIPVLVIPATAPHVTSVTDIARHVRAVVAPVDFTDASPRQGKVAAGAAASLGVPLLLAHVLEPIYVPPRVKLAIPGLDHDRRAAAQRKLLEQLESYQSDSPVETLLLSGDAAEEIAGVAEARRAGLIVMGLHSSERLGHRMGSVTYRVLCLTRSLVLALPPTTDTAPYAAANPAFAEGVRAQSRS
jgi:nucleotide-binding universal stress UspA family protein